MPPIEPDLDPWDDTQEGRGEEMDDPYLTVRDSPLGPSSELLGVPNWRRGIRRGPPIRRNVTTRAILVLLLAIILFGIVATLITNLSR